MIWESERFRFLAVGAYNTLFGYLVFAGLYLLLKERVNYMVIAVVAQAIAIVNSFFAQRILVFRSRGSLRAEFVRYNVTTLGSTALGLAGLAALVDFGGMHPLLAQAVVLAVTVVFTYVAHRNFTFVRRS